MRLYHCTLTFHDSLFYETRTMGRLYETGRRSTTSRCAMRSALRKRHITT